MSVENTEIKISFLIPDKQADDVQFAGFNLTFKGRICAKADVEPSTEHDELIEFDVRKLAVLVSENTDGTKNKLTLEEFTAELKSGDNPLFKPGAEWLITFDHDEIAKKAISIDQFPTGSNGEAYILQFEVELEFSKTGQTGGVSSRFKKSESVEIFKPRPALSNEACFVRLSPAQSGLLEEVDGLTIFGKNGLLIDPIAVENKADQRTEFQQRPGTCIKPKSSSEIETQITFDLDASYRFKLEPLMCFTLSGSENVNAQVVKGGSKQNDKVFEFDLKYGKFWDEPINENNPSGIKWIDLVKVCEITHHHDKASNNCNLFSRLVTHLRDSSSSHFARRFLTSDRHHYALCFDLVPTEFKLDHFVRSFNSAEPGDVFLSIVYGSDTEKTTRESFQHLVNISFSEEALSKKRMIVSSEAGDRAIVVSETDRFTGAVAPEIVIDRNAIDPKEKATTNDQKINLHFENENKGDFSGYTLKTTNENLGGQQPSGSRGDGDVNVIRFPQPAVRLINLYKCFVNDQKNEFKAGITEISIGVFSPKDVIQEMILRLGVKVVEKIIALDIGTQAVAIAKSDGSGNISSLEIGEHIRDALKDLSVGQPTDESIEAFLLGSRFRVSHAFDASRAPVSPIIDLLVSSRGRAAFDESETGLEQMIARTQHWDEKLDIHLMPTDADTDNGTTFEISDVKSPVGAAEMFLDVGCRYFVPENAEFFYRNKAYGNKVRSEGLRTTELLSSVLKHLVCGVLSVSDASQFEETSARAEIVQRVVLIVTYPASFSQDAINRYCEALEQCAQVLQKVQNLACGVFCYLVPEGLAVLEGMPDLIRKNLEIGLGKATVIDIGAGTIDVSAVNLMKSQDELRILSQDLSFSVPLGGRLLDEAIGRDMAQKNGVDLNEEQLIELTTRIEAAKRSRDLVRDENGEVVKIVVPVAVDQNDRDPKSDLHEFLTSSDSHMSSYFDAIEEFVFAPVLSRATGNNSLIILTGRCSMFPEFKKRLEKAHSGIVKDMPKLIYANDFNVGNYGNRRAAE